VQKCKQAKQNANLPARKWALQCIFFGRILRLKLQRCEVQRKARPFRKSRYIQMQIQKRRYKDTEILIQRYIYKDIKPQPVMSIPIPIPISIYIHMHSPISPDAIAQFSSRLCPTFRVDADHMVICIGSDLPATLIFSPFFFGSGACDYYDFVLDFVFRHSLLVAF